MSAKIRYKVDWLRDYAPSSIACDAQGVWLDYQYNRITQRQAVIRLNKLIKSAQRIKHWQHIVTELNC